MDYRSALKYIEGVSWLGSRPGLERISALLERLGRPQDALKFVHVAGTNGKGSVCALLRHTLSAAGYRTGLYISPHLSRMNERMSVDGADVSDAAFAEAVGELAQAAQGMDEPCTEFELCTALALHWFRKERCDIVVLETGLGGRLDATNAIGVPEGELHARQEVFQEEYCKRVTIEGRTALVMARREILPAASRFASQLAAAAAAQRAVMPERRARYECSTLGSLTQLMDAAYSLTGELEDALVSADAMHDTEAKSFFLRDRVLPVMGALRAACDDMETLTPDDMWPMPTYGELLYGVK